jgi:hypothetical protein
MIGLRAAFLFALFIITVYANTEKTIFSAPSIPGGASLNLSLASLSPWAPKLRQSLPVAFPTDHQPYGPESWYLLRHLGPRQRHEVRVCWAATQPTNFRLDVFDIHQLLTNPDLFAAASKSAVELSDEWDPSAQDTVATAVVLRIRAAADFFTTDKTRMQFPPPVDVDIILDPYHANLFPGSLLPTAGYIICLAIGSWVISGTIWSRLQSISNDSNKEHTE